MWLVVGLGNPGTKYAFTRHNVGFMAVDFLHQSIGNPPIKTDFKSHIAKFKLDNEEVVTAQPQTYMNLSGEAVQAIMAFYKIDREHLIVLQDDIDQAFGQIKIQKNRGHGGHNGIRDISEKLSSSDYIRIKIGVGRPLNPNIPVADYVLQKFSDEELQTLKPLLEKSIQAIDLLIFEGLQKASTKINS